jgi:predicted NUDIX family NTP pyrophosphohydrolase
VRSEGLLRYRSQQLTIPLGLVRSEGLLWYRSQQLTIPLGLVRSEGLLRYRSQQPTIPLGLVRSEGLLWYRSQQPTIPLGLVRSEGLLRYRSQQPTIPLGLVRSEGLLWYRSQQWPSWRVAELFTGTTCTLLFVPYHQWLVTSRDVVSCTLDDHVLPACRPTGALISSEATQLTLMTSLGKLHGFTSSGS